MRALEDFAHVLGGPLRPVDTAILQSLGMLWGVNLPEDFLEIMCAYGDSKISDFIWIYGPRTLGFAGEHSGPGLSDWSGDRRGVPLLPVPNGLLLWGSTLEGDMLCLKQQPTGHWIVSVSLRNWFEWRDYDLDFSDWFHSALTGQIGDDWLPEWAPLPHPIKEWGKNPFGVLSMGTGPAGASLDPA
ncbi:hypothetical protein ABH920_006758 [Catenulispora sp. EB89]|uniref:hypothetical protein n=1 Tax=Catenulispora sp. EB89 TaxID=3156257 RepID=UPI003513EB75